jgi:hypothetical protein
MQVDRQTDRHDEVDGHFSQLFCEYNIRGCKYGAAGKSGRNKDPDTVQNQAERYQTHHCGRE